MDDTISVLLVDDDPSFAEMAAEILERAEDQFRVHVESDARAGLDRVAEDDVDCVVSDLDMPDVDGLEFLEAIREDEGDLPFVLFTGKGSEEIASEAISAGVTDYLQKEGGTDQFDVLANRIENAVEATRTERELEERESHLRQAQAVGNIGSWQLDLVENRLDWSEEVYRIFAVDADEELTFERFLEFVHPDDRARIEREWNAALEDGEYDVEHRIVTGDGETRWVRERADVEFDDDGTPVTALGVVQDVTERKEREGELERYETFVETIAGGVFAQDAEGRYSYANSHAEEKTGYDREEIVGEDPTLFVDEAEIERYNGAIAEMLAGERESITAETEIEAADGEMIPVEMRLTLLPSDDGFRGTVGVVHDISERKERERALEQYQAIVEAVGDAAYRLNADGHFAFVSDALTELTGYDADELLGEHVSLVMREADIETGEALIGELLEDEERTHGTFELEAIRADGERVPCEDHMALLWEDGEFAGTAGVVRDVTARKERERELERHRETLEQLHETANRLHAADSKAACLDVTIEAAVSILGFDWCTLAAPGPDGRLFEIKAVSEGAPVAAGDTPFALDEGIAGKVYQSGSPEIVEDAQAAEAGKPVDDAIESGLTVPVGDWGVFQAVTTTGEGFDEHDRRQAELLVSSLYSAIQRLDQRAELRRRQSALKRQNEQLEEFASIVSHDLRNPLNVADGRVELAGEDCDSEHLDAAARAIERMDRLIEDVLTLAREGEQVQELGNVSLPAVCERCWGHVDTADATLEVATDRRIRADSNRLQQLLENLFRNAVEHGGETVTVTVEDRPDGFSVADDGPGIPEADREDVFDRGYSTSREGVGFGLRIVEQIVDAHGWDVAVAESESGGARLDVTGVEFVQD